MLAASGAGRAIGFLILGEKCMEASVVIAPREIYVDNAYRGYKHIYGQKYWEYMGRQITERLEKLIKTRTTYISPLWFSLRCP